MSLDGTVSDAEELFEEQRSQIEDELQEALGMDVKTTDISKSSDRRAAFTVNVELPELKERIDAELDGYTADVRSNITVYFDGKDDEE